MEAYSVGELRSLLIGRAKLDRYASLQSSKLAEIENMDETTEVATQVGKS